MKHLLHLRKETEMTPLEIEHLAFNVGMLTFVSYAWYRWVKSNRTIDAMRAERKREEGCRCISPPSHRSGNSKQR